MSLARLRLAAVAACALLAAPSAHALTIGEYRRAFEAAHAMDKMSANDQQAYINAHRSELAYAQSQLEAAELSAETLVRMNLLQMEASRPPFICNYDEEAQGELEIDDWVDEYRKEAPVKFKLTPGPATDAKIDQVEMDDLIAHKIMEKYPCPMPKAPAVRKTATKAAATKAHDQHADNR